MNRGLVRGVGPAQFLPPWMGADPSLDGYAPVLDSASEGGIKLAAPAAWTLISSQVLASAAASVTFSSIPGTYNSLLVTILARSDAASVSPSMAVQVNGDTGANYDYQLIAGNSTTVSASKFAAQSNHSAFVIPGANSVANAAGTGEIQLDEYAATTFHKTIRSQGGYTEGTNGFWSSQVGRWRSTAAINSIKLTASAGNYVTGSTFRLYGRL